MNSLDYLIVGIYAVVLIAIATYVSLSKKGEKRRQRSIFLQEDLCLGGLLELRL